MDNSDNNSDNKTNPFFKEKQFSDLTSQQRRALRSAAAYWNYSAEMETVWEAGQRISEETNIDVRIVLDVLQGYVAL